MQYTARNVIPGEELPEEYRKKHGLSKAAHWAFDQRTEGKPRTRTLSRPALRQEDLPRVGSVPRGMLGYGKGHGARLRAERRNWAREAAYTLAGTEAATAGALAKAGTAETERRERGATRRLRMREAGLGERLGREQEYARPGQEAEISRLGALEELREVEAEKVRYGTEFERGSRGTIEDILKSRARLRGSETREAELGVSEMERDIRRRDEAETSARIRAEEAKAEAEAGAAKSAALAKPERELNPALRKMLWEGMPGMYGSPEQFYGAYKLLGKGARRIRDWAYPEVR